MLTALNGLGPEQIRRGCSLVGPILESFVFGELLKLAGATDDRITISHFRDRDRNEVDFVKENTRGEIIGIEVKAAVTVYNRDSSGLRRLATACGDIFKLGTILCDNDTVARFGDWFVAAPVSALRS